MKNNENVIIKPADKGSAVVILDKQSYVNVGQRQLHNAQFYEETDSDHTGEVINRANFHVHHMLQRGQIPQSTCKITLQLKLIELNNLTYYLKSIKIH